MLNVIFFRTETENEPVREWLRGLDKADKQSFIKKTQKTPRRDLRLARKRKDIWEKGREA